MFPLHERNLMLFITYLARFVTAATIRVYLSGIQYESVVRGYQHKISNMNRLFYVFQGIKRQKSSIARQVRLPITPNHIKSLLLFINDSLFSCFDKAMWSCLILVAFFGLLRV